MGLKIKIMKKLIIGMVLLVIGLVSFISCGNGSATEKPNGEAGYEILKKWELPDELREISGISWIGENRIASVQDEDGIIFIYNLETSKIEKSIPFGEGGDYEGITVVGDNAYVLRSDGVIFEVSDFDKDDVKVEIYKTGMQELKGINIEGICADPENNRLLLAVKQRRGSKDNKEIYSFGLESKNTGKEPFFMIKSSDSIFNKLTGRNKNNFSPGEIAIHPQSGEIYVLDGTNPKLLIMEKNGKMKNLILFRAEDFGNPEGLTFSPGGEIYISNEAEGGPANILQVSLK